MSNIYKISYNQLRQRPELTEMLNALQRGFDKFGIDFYLIGAVARDAWMSGINGIAPSRTTRDVDFAVLISDKSSYDELKQYLILTEGFQPVTTNAFVLLWKDGLEVDLLPFGAIEDSDGKVEIDGLGLTNINLQGFTEVYENGLPILSIENQHQFKLCTLPGIVLLKMIAWDDRPEHRRDDIKDISHILNHFFDMYDEEIWNNHNDLFEGNDTDLKHIAARVMGREIRKIANRKQELFARIEMILSKSTISVTDSKMASIMTEYFENTVEENVMLLQQLQNGFHENK